ncbi:MAG: alpha/beta fold hydrolase [Shewanellaceae bacterium]|nr:alpha/beta fold hydrolase [Shewanellaceae bacterium]
MQAFAFKNFFIYICLTLILTFVLGWHLTESKVKYSFIYRQFFEISLSNRIDQFYVSVPSSYENKGLKSTKSVQIFISRYQAPSFFQKKVLFINTGGPGIPQVDNMSSILASLPASIKLTHDIIMFDPRATGRSQYANDIKNCNDKTTCYALFKQIKHELRDEVTVHDLEFIRHILHYDKISLLGYSYGARLFTHYAALYPNVIDALVLDSSGSNPNDDNVFANMADLIDLKLRYVNYKYKMLNLDFKQIVNLIKSANPQTGFINIKNNTKIEQSNLLKLTSSFSENMYIRDLFPLNYKQSIFIHCANTYFKKDSAIFIKKIRSLTTNEFHMLGVWDNLLIQKMRSQNDLELIQTAILAVDLTLKESIFDDLFFDEQLTKTKNIDKQKQPTSLITLSRTPLIVESDYDPIVPQKWMNSTRHQYDAYHLIEAHNSAFHAMTFIKKIACIDNIVEDYLLDEINTDIIQHTCDLSKKTKVKIDSYSFITDYIDSKNNQFLRELLPLNQRL